VATVLLFGLFTLTTGQLPLQPSFDPSVSGRPFKSPNSYLWAPYPGPGVQTGVQLRLVALDGGVVRETAMLGAQGGARPSDVAGVATLAEGSRHAYHLRFFNAAGPSPWSDGGLLTWDPTPPTFGGTVSWVGSSSGGPIQLAFMGMADGTSGPRHYRAGYRLADGGAFVDDYDYQPTTPSFLTSLGPGTWEARLTAVDQADNETTVEVTGRFTITAVTTAQLDAGFPCAFCQSTLSWIPLQPIANAANYLSMSRPQNGGWGFSYRARGTPLALAGSDVPGLAVQSRFCVVFTDGGVSDWVQVPGQRVYDPDAPLAPGQVTAALDDAGVRLSWTAATDAISGIDRYQVERRPDATMLWTLVSRLSALTTTDDPGPGRWRYRVTAFDLAGNPSLPAEPMSAVEVPTSDLTPPTVPGVPVPRGSAPFQSPVALDWSASTDGDGGTVGYELERLDVLAGPPRVLQVVTQPSALEVVSPGRYTWRVRAVDGAQNRSAFSAESLVLEVVGPDTGADDGGFDAGSSVDAGPQDAGAGGDAGADAGTTGDARPPPLPVDLTVGCGCASLDGSGLVTLIAALVLDRRWRLRAGRRS
jgi:hypothetical protein